MERVVIHDDGEDIKVIQMQTREQDKDTKEWIDIPRQECLIKVNIQRISQLYPDFATICTVFRRNGVVTLFHIPGAMKLWLKAVQGNINPEHYLNLPRREAIEVIRIGRKFEFRNEIPQPWFQRWYEITTNIQECLIKQTLGQLKKDFPLAWMTDILTLAYFFDHAEGIRWSTYHLVYDHPGQFYGNKLIPRPLTEQVNHARRTLSNNIDRAIAWPLYRFQQFQCSCKEMSTFKYVGALKKFNAFNGRSVFDLLAACSKFEMTDIFDNLHKHFPGCREDRSVHQQIMNCTSFVFHPGQSACYSCQRVIKNGKGGSVEKLQCYIMKEFKGLCIDCLTSDVEITDGHFPNSYPDCRISHDRTTGYFSLSGKIEDCDDYMEDYRDRKRMREQTAMKSINNGLANMTVADASAP